jgi:hypothetical protein
MSNTRASLPPDIQTELYGSLNRLRAELPNSVDRTFIAEEMVRRVEIVRPDAHLTTQETLRNASTTGCTELVHIWSRMRQPSSSASV